MGQVVTWGKWLHGGSGYMGQVVKSRKKFCMWGWGEWVVILAFLLTKNFCHSLPSGVGDGKTDRLINDDNFSLLVEFSRNIQR